MLFKNNILKGFFWIYNNNIFNRIMLFGYVIAIP